MSAALKPRGRFITLEGIEGAGKSSVTLILQRRLEALGQTVCVTREPGGTPLAERLRELVLTRGDELLSREAETLLMFAARAVHLDNKLRPALARGEWVLCDRFTDATRAYQGAGRGVDSLLIEQLASAVHGSVQPSLTLLLDLPVELGLERARQRRLDRGELVADRFESETVQFFTRVRQCYRQIAEREPQRVVLIDATQPLEAVARAAERALETLLV
jgi:dTMP kinase